MYRKTNPARASGKGRDFCDVFAPRLDSTCRFWVWNGKMRPLGLARRMEPCSRRFVLGVPAPQTLHPGIIVDEFTTPAWRPKTPTMPPASLNTAPKSVTLNPKCRTPSLKIESPELQMTKARRAEPLQVLRLRRPSVVCFRDLEA